MQLLHLRQPEPALLAAGPHHGVLQPGVAQTEPLARPDLLWEEGGEAQFS